MKQMSGSRLFMIAVVCAVIAAFLIIYYLKSVEEKYRKASQPAVVETVAVVVPRRNLNRGDSISLDSIGRLEVPRQYLPSNYVPASEYRNILNRTLASPVQAGRVMTMEAITGTKAETFSETVDIGKRAHSLRVSKVDSFDGLLRPGDSIDLMGEFNLQSFGVVSSGGAAGGGGQESDKVIMPVLERVVVISAGREDHTGRRYERTPQPNSSDGFNMEFTIVTLSLTPRQVARVRLAESTGNVFAVLRHPEDTSMANFEQLRATTLLSPDAPESFSVVLDEHGNPIGRVIGDNIVDDHGNIIGKVVGGKAVGLDGKVLGSIVENVSVDDPLLRVRGRADVVLDADGNVIGRIVDGKVVDRDGNVIGRVDASGRAIGLDGKELGRVVRDAPLDAQGNLVDLTGSAVAGRTQIGQVVRDADGNVIGRVVDGNIVDASGRVIGRVDESGRAVSLTGEVLGVVEDAVLDADGNVVGKVKQVVRGADGRIVGEVQDVVRDADGNIIGRVVNGQIINADGEVIGHVDASGRAIGVDGRVLGTVEQAVVDAQSNIVGRVDASGRAIGLDGQVLGSIEKQMVDADGNVIGEAVEVVRDADGNIIGRLVDGKVVDASGRVIGELRNGQVVDASGRVIADGVSVSTESLAQVAAEMRAAEQPITREVDYIEFIPGGTGKEGVLPVRRIHLQ